MLTVIQRAIAGLIRLNERPTSRATDDDPTPAARAARALISSTRAPSALRNGLLQLPDVRDVKIVEMPNGVPGEVALNISLAQGVATQGDELPDTVKARIRAVPPASASSAARPG